MKKYTRLLAGVLSVLGLSAGASQADTILSVTETHYDTNLRPDCLAVRMNATTFADAPSNACTPKTAVGTNGPDRIAKTVYDNAGQVLAVYKGVGTSSIIQYAYYNYTPNGLKAYEIDANHNKTTYSYDGFDRLSKVQYPNTTVGNEISSTTDIEQFAYDANNNRTWWKRRNGVYIYYNYDNLNREILSYPGDSSIPNLYSGYDLQGHILYKRSGNNTASTPGVTYTYDALGRVISANDFNGRTIAYNYDEASRRLRMYYPDSANYVYYTRDYLGRTTTASLNGTSTYLYQQTFDSRGFPYTLTRGSAAVGGTTSYTIDAIGRMSGMAINIDGATTTHDASWTFTRNPASQVISWTSTGPFDYLEAATSTLSKTYDGLNRDASIAAVSGGYDTNGNVTKDTSRVMKYDVYNRLLSVATLSTPTTPFMTLTYDTEGRLSAVTTSGTTKEFLYDGTNLIGEYTHVGTSSTVHTSDTMAARYVHGDGVDQPLVWYTSAATTAPQYLFANYQGSIVAYTNVSGAFGQSYAYDPYGLPVNATGGAYWLGSRFRYTGQIALPEASLYYYKARIYDPAAGRFLQTDPVGSKDDLDLYAYVGGDPINKSDPTGLDAFQVGVTFELGPWRWTSGSYRVGDEPGSILDGRGNSLGKFSSSGGGLGLALGANVSATYCKNCNSVSDIQGTSQSASGNLVLGLGISKPTKDQMDYMGGSFKKAVDGKDAYTVSIGPDIGLVLLGEDKTKVTPTVANGVILPPPPEQQSEWTKPNADVMKYQQMRKRQTECALKPGPHICS